MSPEQCVETNPRPYLVKGMLAEADVGCIVGAPGVGKSVLAPALAYAVAQPSTRWSRMAGSGITAPRCAVPELEESGQSALLLRLRVCLLLEIVRC
jgi:hypothetical protein